MLNKVALLLTCLCVVKASVITVNVYDDSVRSLKSCNNVGCDQLCRRLGFPSGVCVNGRCKCDNFLHETHVEDTHESSNAESDSATRAVRGCKIQKCDQRCRRIGYTGGVCVDGRCKCDINEIEASSEQSSLKSCNNGACNQLCHRLGFTGGVCVNGRCKCDNFLTSHTLADSDSATHAVRDCSYQECDQSCRRIGCTGGVCVNGRCKCDINKGEDSSANDSLEVEHENTDSILNTSEGDVSVPLRVCDPIACNIVCQSLNYVGGQCSAGECQCF